MELIDTHCHLTFEQYRGNVVDVIDRSRQSGVTGWITVGTDMDDSRRAVALAEGFDGMYAAVGIHPNHAGDVEKADILQLEMLARKKKVVAIGETGLDFHYGIEQRPRQRRLFIEHLAIASGLGLPVIVHCRDAFEETMDVLESFNGPLPAAVFHCFSGSRRQAELLVNRGFFISFTGVITFKNAQSSREAFAAVPLNRLMLETDCPYLSPEPVRGRKVNEPSFLVHLAGYMAGLAGLSLDELATGLSATTRRFFALPDGGGGDG